MRCSSFLLSLSFLLFLSLSLSSSNAASILLRVSFIWSMRVVNPSFSATNASLCAVKVFTSSSFPFANASSISALSLSISFTFFSNFVFNSNASSRNSSKLMSISSSRPFISIIFSSMTLFLAINSSIDSFNMVLRPVFPSIAASHMSFSICFIVSAFLSYSALRVSYCFLCAAKSSCMFFNLFVIVSRRILTASFRSTSVWRVARSVSVSAVSPLATASAISLSNRRISARFSPYSVFSFASSILSASDSLILTIFRNRCSIPLDMDSCAIAASCSPLRVSILS